MSKCYVYILFSETLSKYYCGQTWSIEKRISEHNDGLTQSTRNGKPWKVVWYHELSSRAEAMKLEKKIKQRGIKRFLDDINFGM